MIKRGNNRTFLGMDIQILENNKLEIGMKSYIQEYISFFNDDVFTELLSPESKNLHKYNPDFLTLTKNQAEDFCSIIENHLWKN